MTFDVESSSQVPRGASRTSRVSLGLEVERARVAREWDAPRAPARRARFWLSSLFSTTRTRTLRATPLAKRVPVIPCPVRSTPSEAVSKFGAVYGNALSHALKVKPYP